MRWLWWLHGCSLRWCAECHTESGRPGLEVRGCRWRERSLVRLLSLQ